MKLSIICPVFNGEKYLREAIESVISQNYSDWELIIIDDCSSDSSPLIANSFANNEKRIKVISNFVNKGQFYSRIEGIKTATGDAIVFLDSDDKLDSECLYVLNNEFSSKPELESIVYNCNQIPVGNLPIQNIDQISELISCSSGLTFYKEVFINKTIPTVWRYCFKHDFLNKIVAKDLYCDTKLGEDGFFLTVAILNCSSSLLIPNSLYYYRLNPNSICHTLNSDKTFDRFKSQEMSYNYVYMFNKELFSYLSSKDKNAIAWCIVNYLKFGSQEDNSYLFKERCSIIRESLVWRKFAKNHKFQSKFPRIIMWCFRNHFLFLIKTISKKYSD